jgi:hypothetical protein
VGGQHHAPAALPPGQRPGTHGIGGWLGPRAGRDGFGKSRRPPGFDPRTVQPVVSRYTDWAIPARIVDCASRYIGIMKPTWCTIYPDDGQQTSPKHVEFYWWNRVMINIASSWFHYRDLYGVCCIDSSNVLICNTTGWSKSLWTSWLQHMSFLPHYLVQSGCLAAYRQGQGDTRLTLTSSVIPNSNYVIMVSDWNCLKYFCVFLYCNHQVHRELWSLCIKHNGM